MAVYKGSFSSMTFCTVCAGFKDYLKLSSLKIPILHSASNYIQRVHYVLPVTGLQLNGCNSPYKILIFNHIWLNGKTTRTYLKTFRIDGCNFQDPHRLFTVNGFKSLSLFDAFNSITPLPEEEESMNNLCKCGTVVNKTWRTGLSIIDTKLIDL